MLVIPSNLRDAFWQAASQRGTRIAFYTWCLVATYLLSVAWVDFWRDPTGVLPFWRHGGPPQLIEAISEVPWVGSWPTPDLCGLSEDTESSTVALMLHIFSTPQKDARVRRDLLRDLSPLSALPERYRHLVELKFVVGHPPAPSSDPSSTHHDMYDSECTLAMEQAEHGDLLRLDDLYQGDNMNNGKTWEWIRYLGQQSPREALWAVKMDDDTLPFLQNLVPWLLTLDPAHPVYFGSMQPMPEHDSHFALGPLYGLSWSAIKSIAAAEVTPEEIQNWYPEDLRTATLVRSLPDAPADATIVESEPIFTLPPAPRRRKCHSKVSLETRHIENLRELIGSVRAPEETASSGVRWINLPHLIDQWFHPLAKSARLSFAWHGFKTDKSYRVAYQAAQEEMALSGLGWEWVPPKELAWLAKEE